MTKRVSRRHYIGSVVAAYTLLVLLALMTAFVAQEHPSDVPAWQLAQGFVGSCLTVLLLRLWFLAWEGLPRERARITPGRAIGYLFIPFFNLYWIFQLSVGFTQDFANVRFSEMNRGQDLPRGLFVAFPVYVIVAWVLSLTPLSRTYVWPFVLSIGALVTSLVTFHLCNAVNAMRDEAIIGTAEAGG